MSPTSSTRARYLWAVLGTCALLAVLESAHASLVARVHGEAADFIALLLRDAPFWIALALLVPVIGWGAVRFPPQGPALVRAVALHAAAGAAFPLVQRACTDVLAFLLTGTPPVFRSSPSPGWFMMGLLLYWLVVGAHVVHLLQRRHARAVEEADSLRLAARRLAGSLHDANLQSLRRELGPHFLFNALNSLAVLAEQERATGVVQLIGRLSALLRAALGQRSSTTTLAQELDFIGRYVDYERVCFEDRLDVAWQVSPDCLHACVPALVLQPLVENAVKHGFDPHTGRASILIGAERVDGRLRLWVADHGPGLATRRDREGIGLRNTRDRLNQLFGGSGALRLDAGRDAGVTATITIPWMAQEAALEEMQP